MNFEMLLAIFIVCCTIIEVVRIRSQRHQLPPHDEDDDE